MSLLLFLYFLHLSIFSAYMLLLLYPKNEPIHLPLTSPNNSAGDWPRDGFFFIYKIASIQSKILHPISLMIFIYVSRRNWNLKMKLHCLFFCLACVLDKKKE